jgi:hypothetical protein
VVSTVKNVLMIIGTIVVVIAYGVGIVGIAMSPHTSPQEPASTRYVISGVIAMMAGLLVFVLGFVHTATIGSKSPAN